ncbi:RDD family protein [Campylobacter sp. RM12327]|uniref:RDD family protein n=1 Tax=Campylobacter sputorum TaxID=206 RepID=UPI000B790C41|nr:MULTISPECIES: RDD family protein [Campylobacter]ASM40183.1 RDD domain protein [Campylobacter sputorum]MBE7358642.1 RDD family protein [Campylobacter sp. RM11302]MBF6669967.1 RDD family protein [Campylobacter sp. RM12327]MBF6675121.1 RDD family protein [Campylobacter sp. RM13538]MBF6676456.1 RDD family protein [Campylobacter sp. RM12321]
MSDNVLKKLNTEGIDIAPMNKRFLSYAIDEVLLSLLFVIIYWDFFTTNNDFEQTLQMVSSMSLQLVLLKVVYQSFFIWYYGATIGKIICKIVCIDVVMLSKPKLSTAILRAIFRIVSESFLYLGFVWALGNQLRQTWHDKIAKTVVINAY